MEGGKAGNAGDNMLDGIMPGASAQVKASGA